MRLKLQNIIYDFANYKVNAVEIITCGGKYYNNIDYFSNYATQEMFDNLEMLLKMVNIFREEYGEPFVVNSGFRRPDVNVKIGGAKQSKHTECLAVDIRDLDGNIDNWFLQHQQLLRQYNCAVENPRYTKGWCHFQCILPSSKKLIFKPYVREPLSKEIDTSFDYLKKLGL